MGNYFDLMIERTKTHSLPADTTETYKMQVQGDGFILWHANIDDIDSVEDNSPLIMSLLPEEKTKVKRFLFVEDQKRALLSILLQRSLIRYRFGVSDTEYELIRTKEVNDTWLLSGHST